MPAATTGIADYCSLSTHYCSLKVFQRLCARLSAVAAVAESIGARIEMVRGSLSQAEFGEQLGVAKDTIGKYERGKITPGGDVLGRMHTIFGVDINWLLTGNGEMHPSMPAIHSETIMAEPAQARDPDLYGRVLEAISAVYKEMGWAMTLRQLGAEAAQIADEIAAEGLTPEDKPPAVKAAAAMLRRQLRAAAANPTSAAAKDQA